MFDYEIQSSTKIPCKIKLKNKQVLQLTGYKMSKKLTEDKKANREKTKQF